MPKPTIIRAALYARVSTINTHQDPEVQLMELREYACHRGWKMVAEYVDKGISGAKTKRPGLDKLMADAHRRKFDLVCVWKFDRFARSVIHLLNALEEFRGLGIEFCSYRDQIDTSTAMGRAMYTIVATIAELERDLIIERIHSGLRTARAKGKQLGRPRLDINDKIAALREAGLSYRAIARELKVSLPTVWSRTRTAPSLTEEGRRF